MSEIDLLARTVPSGFTTKKTVPSAVTFQSVILKGPLELSPNTVSTVQFPKM